MNQGLLRDDVCAEKAVRLEEERGFRAGCGADWSVDSRGGKARGVEEGGGGRRVWSPQVLHGGLMWYTRRSRVEGRAESGKEEEGEEEGCRESSEWRMQRRGTRRLTSGLSGERKSLRRKRKPQLHVNWGERRFPPHPGGMGR